MVAGRLRRIGGVRGRWKSRNDRVCRERKSRGVTVVRRRRFRQASKLSMINRSEIELVLLPALLHSFRQFHRPCHCPPSPLYCSHNHNDTAPTGSLTPLPRQPFRGVSLTTQQNVRFRQLTVEARTGMASTMRRGPGKIRAPRRVPYPSPSSRALIADRGQQALHGVDVDFEQAWNTLERAFKEIHTKNASELSFEELYRNAYRIVLKKKGEELYHKVAQFEEAWLGNENTSNTRRKVGRGPAISQGAEECMGGPSTVHGYADRRLDVHGKSTARSTPQISGLANMTMEDRVYCTDNRQPSIFAKSMGLFRDQILRAPAQSSMPPVQEFLTRIILDHIQMDRDGEPIDQYLIKSNMYMLEGLYDSDQEVEDEKLYLQFFEPVFLQTSADFYKEEAERLLRESDAGEYCRQTRRRISEENDRCRSTLSESTTAKLQHVVEEELIRHKIKGLIEMESGVNHMVENDQMEELNLIFDLESRVDPRKNELTRAMQKIITAMGTNINNAVLEVSVAGSKAVAVGEEQEDGNKKTGAAKVTNQQTAAALKWVEEILALRDRFDNICAVAFASDQTVSTAINRSLADVINAFARSSEYISLFIDDNMKKGIKNKSEAEIDNTLEKAITILRFLMDKDIFETYYKKHLCKRLLLNKSQSIDVEKQMISRMKIELGNSFTLKLEVMFKDMTLSEDLTSGYQSHVTNLGDADPKRTDISIKVLTSMTWPLDAFRVGQEGEQPDTRHQIVYPSIIRRIKTGFESFYQQKYSGRKLTWLSNMGDADIKATFPKSKNGKPRTHEINCSTYAMLILLLFNELPADHSLSLEEIQAQTNIPMNDLTRNLQSLAVAPKTRFLL
nr:cullin-3 [Quercus suber]